MSSFVVSLVSLIGMIMVGGLVWVGIRGEHHASPSLRSVKRTGTMLAFAGLVVTGLIAFGIARWRGISRDDPRVFWFFVAASFGIVPGFIVIGVRAQRLGRAELETDNVSRHGERQ